MKWRMGINCVIAISLLLITPLCSPQSLPCTECAAQTLAATHEFEFVSQLGGVVQAVVVSGDYAYVGVGWHMVILDITDPTQPAEVGRTELLPGTVECLAVSGYYAYAMAGGLQVISLLDKSAPEVVGTLPIEAVDIDVSGNYAYLAAGEMGLLVIDIRTPSAPQVQAVYDIDGDAIAISVYANHAYLAAGCDGVVVLDVSDLSDITEASRFYPSSDSVWGFRCIKDVYTSEGYAYTMGYFSNPYHPLKGVVGMTMTDISDPAHPSHAGSFTPDPEYGQEGWGIKIYAVSGRACMLTFEWNDSSPEGWYTLYVLDVTAPGALYWSSPLGTCGFAVRPCNLCMSDGEAYIALCDAGLQIRDIPDPTICTIYLPPAKTSAVATSGRYAHLLSANTLRTVGVSDPTQPSATGVLDTGGTPTAIDALGSWAYLATHKNPHYSQERYELQVVDLSEPSAPVLASETRITSTIRALHACDGMAYLVGKEWPPGGYHHGPAYAALWTFDVSDATNPQQQQCLHFYADEYTQSMAAALHVANGSAYVLAQQDEWNSDSDLWVVDVHDPEHVYKVGSTPLPGTGYHLCVYGHYAYVTGIADHHGARVPTLWVLDVLPATPSMVNSCPLARGATDIDVSMGYIYSTDGAGVTAMDISDPTAPVVTALFETPGNSQGLDARGRTIYIADEDNGLLILRHTAPGVLYLPLAFKP